MHSLNSLLFVLALVAAVGSGVVGGTFLAFSSFVMRALSRVSAPACIIAMQSINVAVLTSVFLGLFVGTAAVAFGLAVLALVHWRAPVSPLLLLGSLSYLIGTFLITGTRNVPRNQALARIDVSDPEAVGHWHRYLAEWTCWNHVRTVAAIAASMLFALALARL